MKYGDRLRLAREHKGLSQIELAELSGVNKVQSQKSKVIINILQALMRIAYATEVDAYG